MLIPASNACRTRRHTRNNGEGCDVLCDDTSGCQNGPVANGNSIQDSHSGADPYVRPNRNSFLPQSLQHDGLVWCRKNVVRWDQDHLSSYSGPISNSKAPMAIKD